MLNEEKNFITSMSHPHKKILIWGGGSTGIDCLTYFKNTGAEKNVIGFIDSNKSLREVEGYNVFAPEYIYKEAASTVIVASLYWKEILKFIEKSRRLNNVYVYLCFKEVCGKTSLPDINSIFPLYSNDAYTQQLIMLQDNARSNSGHVIVSAKESPFLKTDSGNTGYWEDAETRLDHYNTITLVDAGAYIGDSLTAIGNNIEIVNAYCYEPETNSYQLLCQTIAEKRLNAEAINSGLYETNGFINQVSRGSGITQYVYSNNKKADSVKCVSLDNQKIHISGKLCIKMDIEGLELQALKGAKNTIKTYAPELAICVYHKYSDICDIPKYIKSILPEYNCILRGASHMVCYASAERYRSR